jgi:hypothetical protein
LAYAVLAAREFACQATLTYTQMLNHLQSGKELFLIDKVSILEKPSFLTFLGFECHAPIGQ